MSYVNNIKAPTSISGSAYIDLFKQYEKVIMESLITSFGIDFLITDQHGGDVDTVHNVRKIGKDSEMTYKNKANESAYESKGDYDTYQYHHNEAYISINRQNKLKRDRGNLSDVYTGEQILPGEKFDLDHIISAKEIHDDRGRSLAGIDGVPLANSQENLGATNPHTNRTKKALTMDEFIEKYGDEYTPEQIALMKQRDAEARQSYEAKIAKAYYTSKGFLKDTGKAAAKTGFKMGLRQALGFIFSEIWFAVRKEIADCMEEKSLLKKIGNGVKRGLQNAIKKYKDLWERFVDGAVAGVISSLITTLCNMFFSTAKSLVKIIRQTWASLIQAVKILLLNPDRLPLGEQLRAAAKIVATAASIVAGTMVSELIGKTAVGAIPVVGDIVQTFCGTLVTGIMSCTLLYVMDNNSTIQKAVEMLNNLPSKINTISQLKEQAIEFDKYCAQLMSIDYEIFKQEVDSFNGAVVSLESCNTQQQVNAQLRKIYKKLNFDLPWKGDFDEFMSNPHNKIILK